MTLDKPLAERFSVAKKSRDRNGETSIAQAHISKAHPPD